MANYVSVINAGIDLARSLATAGLEGPFVVRLSYEDGVRLFALVERQMSGIMVTDRDGSADRAGFFEAAGVRFEWPANEEG